MANYTWNTTYTTGHYGDLDWIPAGSAPGPADSATIGSGVDVTDQNFLAIGDPSGATGSVTLTDAGTTLEAQNGLDVGQNGDGSLSVFAGAQLLSTGYNASGGVNARYEVIADFTGSVGIATVDGSGSSWISTSNGMTVGQEGQGSLTITDNGTVSVQHFLNVGLYQTGNGLVTIATGGTLSFASSLTVGNQSSSIGEIDVNAGGALLGTGDPASFASIVYVGLNAGSTGTIKVDGAGARLDTGGNSLYVGLHGTGTLVVGQGATVSAATADSFTSVALGAGFYTGSQGSVTVTGAGSSLTASGYGVVGHGGTGTMIVSDNATAALGDASDGFEVGAGYVHLGTLVNGGSGDLQVTSGGSLHSLSYLEVGDSDIGTLELDHGSVDAAGYLDVGDTNAGAGAGTGTATIGAGGTLSSASFITVGDGAGSTGEIDINAGGSLRATGSAAAFASSVELGNKAGATGTIKVTGANAVLDTGGNPLRVGNRGTGTLTISQGGSVTAGTADSTQDSAVAAGDATGSHGTITVTGAGSSLTAPGFGLLGRGGTGTMLVSDHAVTTVGITTDYFDVGSGGTYGGVFTDGGSGDLHVTTSGRFSSLGNLHVGYRGDTGTMEVDQGGVVEAAVAIGIGDGDTTTGGTGTVTVGPGGTMRAALTPGLLTQTNGNPDAAIYIGDSPGSTGTLNVTGANALVDANGNKISVGSNAAAHSGGTGYLTVSQGGTVDSGAATSGDSALVIASGPANSGTVTVTDAGSVFNAVGKVLVGNSGVGVLDVTNGGILNSGQSNGPNTSNGLLIASSTGGSGFATVDGAGSTLNNLGVFVVGAAGTGSLTISAGGVVNTREGSNSGAGAVIGSAAASSGHVTVDGTGSTWAVTGALDVGLRGSGSLSIQHGGHVTADSLASSGGINVGAPQTGGGTIAATSDLLTIANNFTVGLTPPLVSGTSDYVDLFGGTISVGGNLEIGAHGIIDGSGTIDPAVTTIDTGGRYLASGLLVSPLVVDDGSIEVGTQGLEINGSVGGTGQVSVSQGTLVVDGTLNGAAGDTVTAQIVQGGRLRVLSGSSSGGTVVISSGTLELDQAITFGTQSSGLTIGGFPGGQIDLAGMAYGSGAAASVTQKGALLSVTNGTATEIFALSNPGSLQFSVSQDQGSGILVTAAQAVAPTISGTLAGQTTTGEAAVTPFSGVTIADANTGTTDQLTITLAGGGSLASPTGALSSASPGVYTLAGTAASLTAALRALVFTPAAGATTRFTLSDVSSAGTSALDTATTVIDTPAVAPTISGTLAGQTTSAEASLTPFATVTIGDDNSGATDQLTITLAGGGSLASPTGGLSSASPGVYTLAGTAASLTAALRALVFTPTAGASTRFTLSDASSAGTSALDTATTVIDTPAVAPTISGTLAGQTTSAEASLTPFATVTIGDDNSGATDQLTITLAGGGSLASPTGGLSSASPGVYTLAGTAASLTAALRALVFTPAAGATTRFTLSDASSAGTSALDTATTVIDTPAVAPTISGTLAGQTTSAEASLTPFATVTIGDDNSGATDQLTITLAGGGSLASPTGGLSSASPGVYTLAGTAASLTAALRALVFTPTAGATTRFTLSDASSAGTSALDTATTVIDTPAAVSPTIGGTLAGQTTSAEASLTPFATVTIGDGNSGATDQLTVTLAGGGSLASPTGGLSSASPGVYTLAGTAASLTAALRALVFTPTAGASTRFTLSDVSSAGTSALDTATTVIDTPAVVLPGPVVGFDSKTRVTALNRFVFQGKASSSDTIAGVEIYQGATDLGAATLDPGSGKWSFTFDAAPGLHTGLTAIATDGSGATTTAVSPFNLKTGIRGKPFTAFQSNYDPDSNSLIGQTYYNRQGGVYLKTTVTTNADGSSSQLTSGGSFFRNQAYISSRQDFDASGTPTMLELDNRDGTHSIAGLVAGETLSSIGSDTFNTVGGRNIFAFTPGFGQDTITSFVLGGRNHDTISLPQSDATHLASILANGSTDPFGQTTIRLDRNDTIVIAGVSITDLQNHSGDFTFHA